MPEIVGFVVFCGPLPETTDVAADGDGVEPASLVAVTTIRSVLATSAEATTYEEDVSPLMSAQLVPVEEQRCHWRANDVGGLAQVPSSAVKVAPKVAVPLTCGALTTTGTSPPT